VNVYLAFRAALLAVQRHNAAGGVAIRSLLCPALGAGIGGMPVERVARQMWAVWEEVVLASADWRDSARGILARHAFLLD
jgi:O-acetyl-ADP-ribose deacetylase (regulator of RNase III)